MKFKREPINGFHIAMLFFYAMVFGAIYFLIKNANNF